MLQQIKKLGSVLVAVFWFAAVSSQMAAAGPFDEGVTAYWRGDYAGAIAQWRPLAEQGDGDAQQALGLLSTI
jgi:uncharacterized protein